MRKLKKYKYLYVNRFHDFPQNVGDTIKLDDSYLRYMFLSIELVSPYYIFKEYFICTEELTQSSETNYIYDICGFKLKPTPDKTAFEIVNVPPKENEYHKINVIAGVMEKY